MIRLKSKLSTYFEFMVNRFRSIYDHIISIINQKFCLLCDETCQEKSEIKVKICGECLEDLPWNIHHCYQCALPISFDGTDTRSTTKLICGECLKHIPPFTRTVASFQYKFPIDSIIKLTKYQQQYYWLSPLSDLLFDEIMRTYIQDSLPELLIPVPLHPKREQQRGYNQAQIICKELSNKLKITRNEGILRKSTLTPPQATLNKKQRMKNLQDSFSIDSNTLIFDKHIALIDDVVTTKATSELISELLLTHGASRVDIWCIARTPKNLGANI